MFHQMQPTMGDTACSVKGVLSFDFLSVLKLNTDLTCIEIWSGSFHKSFSCIGIGKVFR